jgi:cytidine deaminase
MDATKLQALAIAASSNAYAPYSHFCVGAALMLENGEIVTGCNVENLSYGLTICAERTVLVKAISDGHHKFQALAIYSPQAHKPLAPCGACRQSIAEFFDKDTPIFLGCANGQWQKTTLDELLPYAFDEKLP